MIVGKHKREIDDDREYEIESQTNNNKKLKNNEYIKSQIKMNYKTINEIRDETYNKYLNLSKEEKSGNNILLELIVDFDINEDIHLKVLSNNLNSLKYHIENLKTNYISELSNLFI